MLYYHTQDKQYHSKCIALIARINNAYIPFYLLRQLMRTMAHNHQFCKEMCVCHYYICISLLISTSLVSLISQYHHMADHELIAILDQDLTVQILDCIDSSLCLSP